MLQRGMWRANEAQSSRTLPPLFEAVTPLAREESSVYEVFDVALKSDVDNFLPVFHHYVRTTPDALPNNFMNRYIKEAVANYCIHFCRNPEMILHARDGNDLRLQFKAITNQANQFVYGTGYHLDYL